MLPSIPGIRLPLQNHNYHNLQNSLLQLLQLLVGCWMRWRLKDRDGDFLEGLVQAT